MTSTGNSDLISIEQDDLPALFAAADRTANRSQRLYLAFFSATLVLTVLAALTAFIAILCPSGRSISAVAGAVVVSLSILATAVLRASKFEKSWYGARAVAESVKTRAWRFAVCAEPYLVSLAPADADNQLIMDLQAILNQRKNLSFAGSLTDTTKPQITEAMRKARALSLLDRLSVYVKQRIDTSRNWYAAKAAKSSSRETWLFFFIFGAQAVTMVAAFSVVSHPDWRPAIGLFAALSSALLAWMQVRRFQETAQSYGITAHELGLIKEKSKHIKTEQEFAVFVADSEAAISREHTLWIARRDAS